MSEFARYLWTLLIRPLKREGSEIERWVTVLGDMFQEAKLAVFAVRRAWYLRTAPASALYEMGEDLGLIQPQDEPTEDYRQRLLAAIDFYSRGGTRPGVEDAVKRAVSDPFVIREYQVDAWKLGRGKLGVSARLFDPAYRATFGLVFNRTLTGAEEARVRALVNQAKPAHTVYLFRYPTAPAIAWRLGSSRLGFDTKLAQGA